MRRPPIGLAILLALSLFVPFPAVLRAAAVLVQSQVNESCTAGSPCNLSFSSNVTTGNTVICLTANIGGSSTTYTCSDATNGTYTDTVTKISSGMGRTIDINDKRNVTGGFTQVTATASTSVAFALYLWEVSGLGSGAAQTGSNDQTAQTAQNASSTGLSGTGFAVAGGSMTNGAGGITAGSGWTLKSAGAFFMAQHQAGTFSGTTCPWTSNSDDAIGACAIFPEPGAAGGCRAALSLLGVGGC